MNCWKTINFAKEVGINRLYMLSFLIGLMSFVLLYIPFSVRHQHVVINEVGVYPLLAAIWFLPTIHTLMHILPLVMMNKRAKLIYKRNTIFIPIVNYYTKKYMSKKASIISASAPTVLLTIPSIMAAYLFGAYYVFFLLFASIHIAISLTDFLYIAYIAKAPKQSLIENDHNEFAILVKAK